MTIDDLRSDLNDKHERGVKQVRVTTMLAALPASLEEAFPAACFLLKEATDSDLAKAGARIVAAQSRVAALEAELEEAKRRRRRPAGPLSDLSYEPGDELVGTAEAAAILGVERPRIGKWRALGKMPDPIAELAAGPVWLREQIEALVEDTEARRRSSKRSEVTAAG